MANCNICGKPVLSAPVHHPECWKKEVEQMAETFCADYCRFPLYYHDKEIMREKQCDNCPLIKVLNLGL